MPNCPRACRSTCPGWQSRITRISCAPGSTRCWADFALLRLLLEFDRLIRAGLVHRRAPDLVRGLVLGPAETERRAEAQIQIAGVFQRVDQPFGVELRAGA